MSEVFINGVITDVGDGANEIIKLRAELAAAQSEIDHLSIYARHRAWCKSAILSGLVEPNECNCGLDKEIQTMADVHFTAHNEVHTGAPRLGLSRLVEIELANVKIERLEAELAVLKAHNLELRTWMWGAGHHQNCITYRNELVDGLLPCSCKKKELLEPHK